jgi:CheY-like chemotaxis protein
MCKDDLLDLRCLLRGCHRAPVYHYTILHVGTSRALAEYLNHELKELGCFVDYCSIRWQPHVLVKSDLRYALLLVDEELGETTGAEFTQFVRSLPHRRDLPVMVVKEADDFNVLAQTILSLLSTNAEAA